MFLNMPINPYAFIPHPSPENPNKYTNQIVNVTLQDAFPIKELGHTAAFGGATLHVPINPWDGRW